tara:strand:+ start:1050 stop:1799 length:750 start_codon:yes stop_codon:yes gene_type:complete
MSPRKKAESNIDNSTGPNLFSRDENGLLKNVQYVFNEDGSVNWRAMIKNEHLFPNRGWFESRGKDVPNTTEGLRDHQLLIKLSGIKELARLRGFTSVSCWAEKCEADHVAVNCTICFIPNYETGGKEVTFQDMANATLENTSSFATKFLETIACNRAFVRCVRNFLNVHIVGDDEIDKSGKPPAIASKNPSPLSPHGVLEKKFGNFDEFKNSLRELWSSGKYKNEKVKEWEDFSDIPPKEARILIGLTK